MIRQPPKFKDALEVLARHHVDFIVVGGVAAVLGGAPSPTFDLTSCTIALRRTWRACPDRPRSRENTT